MDAEWVPIATWVGLVVIGLVLAVAVVASIRFPARQDEPAVLAVPGPRR